MKNNATMIHKDLSSLSNYELTEYSIKLHVKNILAGGGLSAVQKYKLAKMFSDRLIDKIDYDQTS